MSHGRHGWGLSEVNSLFEWRKNTDFLEEEDHVILSVESPEDRLSYRVSKEEIFLEGYRAQPDQVLFLYVTGTYTS